MAIATTPKFTTKTLTLSQMLFDDKDRINVSLNVRDPIDAYEGDELFETIVADMRQTREELGGSGMKVPPEVMEVRQPDGSIRYKPLRGNKRLRALDKSFDYADRSVKFQALVYPPLDELTIARIVWDHGFTADLRKVDIYYGIKKRKDVMSEVEMAVILLPSLRKCYSDLTDDEKAKILPNLNSKDDLVRKDAQQKLLNKYKGTIRDHKWVAELPTCVEEAWVAKLRGKHTWPRNSEIVQLHQIFNDENKPSGGVIPPWSRSNPGPRFKAEWQKILDAVDEANRLGTDKPRKTSMKNNKQVEQLAKTDSLILKMAFLYVMSSIPPEKFKEVEDLQIDIEKAMSPAFHQRLMVIMGLAQKPQPEPASEEVTVTTGEVIEGTFTERQALPA